MSDIETEIKLKVSTPAAVKRLLAKSGLKIVKPRHFERNLLFDFPDGRLRKARCLLRLRYEGTRRILTYKGRPALSNRYKSRQEIETEVGDGDLLKEILESLGMQISFYYEKYRTTYAAGARSPMTSGGHVVLDETPIGNFLELEGPERWIDAAARVLGFGREDYITASYGRLHRLYCQRKGRKPGDMIFRARQ